MSAMASQIASVSIVCSAVFFRSKKTSKRRVIGLCEGNPPVTGGFPLQRTSNAENDFIWWRHHQTGYAIPSFTYFQIWEGSSWRMSVCNRMDIQVRLITTQIFHRIDFKFGWSINYGSVHVVKYCFQEKEMIEFSYCEGGHLGIFPTLVCRLM